MLYPLSDFFESKVSPTQAQSHPTVPRAYFEKPRAAECRNRKSRAHHKPVPLTLRHIASAGMHCLFVCFLKRDSCNSAGKHRVSGQASCCALGPTLASSPLSVQGVGDNVKIHVDYRQRDIEGAVSKQVRLSTMRQRVVMTYFERCLCDELNAALPNTVLIKGRYVKLRCEGVHWYGFSSSLPFRQARSGLLVSCLWGSAAVHQQEFGIVQCACRRNLSRFFRRGSC